MKVSAPSHLLDAGPLVGLLDADDQWHEWSRKTLAAIPGALRTTETAVAEACYHLRNHRPALSAILRMIDAGALVLEPLFNDEQRGLVGYWQTMLRWIFGTPHLWRSLNCIQRLG